jgi:hypothetical protein
LELRHLLRCCRQAESDRLRKQVEDHLYDIDTLEGEKDRMRDLLAVKEKMVSDGATPAHPCFPRSA